MCNCAMLVGETGLYSAAIASNAVDSFMNWAKDNVVLSIFIIAGIIIGSLAKFTTAFSQLSDAVSKLVFFFRKASVRLETNTNEDGTVTLAFKFLHPPKSFAVDSIILHLRQTKPVGVIEGDRSGQVKPARFTTKIPAGVFDLPNPIVIANLRMYHAPREPYALAELRLWYERSNSRISFIACPSYVGPNGHNLKIRTLPEEVEVTLENRPNFRGVPQAEGGN